jgi:hypothetical protein
MTVGNELAHHDLRIDEILGTAETYKSNFQGGTKLRIALAEADLGEFLRSGGEEKAIYG